MQKSRLLPVFVGFLWCITASAQSGVIEDEQNIAAATQLARNVIDLGLKSSSSQVRTRTLLVVSEHGKRFFDLVRDYDSLAATGDERQMFLRALHEQSRIPSDAEELAAFRHFENMEVFMDIQDGHVWRFESQIQLTPDDCEHIKAFTFLKVCRFGREPLSLEVFSAIKNLDHLEQVDLLNDSCELADDSLKLAATLPMLKLLELPSRVTDQGLAALRGKESLKSLWIYSRYVTQEGFANIAECAGLEELSIKTMLNDDGVGALLGLANLRNLKLDSCPISDSGMARFAVLPNLEELDLHLCLWIEGSGLEALAAAPNLRKLTLPASVGTEALSCLRNFPLLESLRLYSLTLDDGVVDALMGCSKLKSVEIYSGAISDEGVERLYQHFGRQGRMANAPGIKIGTVRKPVVYRK